MKIFEVQIFNPGYADKHKLSDDCMNVLNKKIYSFFTNRKTIRRVFMIN